MRIIFWHGYLLTGTGSNIYTSNVCRTFRKEGHDVLLLCQHRRTPPPAFIDEEGDFADDNRSFETDATGAGTAQGRCRLVRPAIGGLLPVYVYDRYPHIEAKRFVELTEEELERYVETNVTALITAIEEHRPDAIFVGHEVMGPYIAKLACESTGASYAVQLHGSALEYAVRPQQRYLRFAIEGLGAARRVIGGSRYMLEAAAKLVPGWEEKGAVVNPGCDVDIFRPRGSSPFSDPIVAFVGRLIPQKGVHNFLAALPLVKNTMFTTVIVGGGKFGESLRDLALSFRSGGIGAAVEKIVSEAPDETTRPLRRFFDEHVDDEAYLSRARELPIDFLGHLDHGPLSEVLPNFEALVVPSIVPEAFAMVGAEAAACEVLPIVPDHSGIGELGAALEEALGEPGLLTFDSNDPISSMANAIDRVLAIPPADRAEMGRTASQYARDNWAWEVVRKRLLEAVLA